MTTRTTGLTMTSMRSHRAWLTTIRLRSSLKTKCTRKTTSCLTTQTKTTVSMKSLSTWKMPSPQPKKSTSRKSCTVGI